MQIVNNFKTTKQYYTTDYWIVL